MAKKKLSALKQAFAKELSRIRKFISRATKRGYSFEEVTLPKTPKRVTQKAVERLKKQYTPEKLYTQAIYKTPTGVQVSGLEGRKYERKTAAEKAAATRARRKAEAPSSGVPLTPDGKAEIPSELDDEEILKNVPIRQGPYLIDPETGEVIADESNNIMDSFLEQIQKFDSIESAALPYRDTMLDWFYNAYSTYGDKFLSALKQMQEIGIGINFQTLRYEEQMSGFLTAFYKTMARMGYMTSQQADAMIEQMQDIAEWDDQNLYE